VGASDPPIVCEIVSHQASPADRLFEPRLNRKQPVFSQESALLGQIAATRLAVPTSKMDEFSYEKTLHALFLGRFREIWF
jgi:hypothetical protein